MKPAISTAVLLTIILIIASCDQLGYGPMPLTIAETNWSVNLMYINPETKEPIIGKERYFSPNHVHILQKEDTSYRDIFYYNYINEPDSQKDGNYIITLSHTVHTEVTKENEKTNISGSVAIAERFDDEFIVQLKHAQADITDTFRLVKDNEHDFKVSLNGSHVLTAPSPTPYKDMQQLTIER